MGHEINAWAAIRILKNRIDLKKVPVDITLWSFCFSYVSVCMTMYTRSQCKNVWKTVGNLGQGQKIWNPLF